MNATNEKKKYPIVPTRMAKYPILKFYIFSRFFLVVILLVHEFWIWHFRFFFFFRPGPTLGVALDLKRFSSPPNGRIALIDRICVRHCKKKQYRYMFLAGEIESNDVLVKSAWPTHRPAEVSGIRTRRMRAYHNHAWVKHFGGANYMAGMHRTHTAWLSVHWSCCELALCAISMLFWQSRHRSHMTELVSRTRTHTHTHTSSRPAQCDAIECTYKLSFSRWLGFRCFVLIVASL